VADFWFWLLSLVKSWELLVGGALTLGLEVANRTWGWKLSKAGYLSIFVILGFFAASFTTWREQYIKAEGRNTGLVGVIDQVITATVSDAGMDNVTVALVELEIKNIGETPTIVGGYRTDIFCPNEGIQTTGQNWKFLSDDRLQKITTSAHLGYSFFDAGPIYMHTSDHPITPGSHSRGWLYVGLPMVSNNYLLTHVGCTWTIGFSDVHDKRYEATKVYTGAETINAPLYFPPTN